MKKNKKADSIAGIIIAVFILSFAMLGIVNVLDYNKDMTYNYEKETDLYILKANSDNVLKSLDVSQIQQNETFYIRKDNINNEFLILTGAINEHYKYVDKNGNNIFEGLNIAEYTDINGEIIIPEKFIGQTFIREFQKRIDILRHDIRPPEIRNLVFHFDANNVNGNYNEGLSNGSTINIWRNLANNGVPDAVDKSTLPEPTRYTSGLPRFNQAGINNLPMVEFNGNQMLGMDLHPEINNDGDIYAQKVFMEKSFAIVFKTGFDITSTQIIYEQGGAATGYNFMIENGDVWAGVHNISNSSYANTNFSPTDSNYYFTWDPGHQYKSVNLGEVLPNTVYFVMVVQDSTHINRTNRPIIEDIKDRRFIHANNRLKIFLNGNLVTETDHVSPQPEHSYGALGNIYRWNVSTVRQIAIDDVNNEETAYFEGGIGELISRNHALSDNEVRGVQNYFEQKWLGGRQTVRYDIVNTHIEEFKNY